MYYKLKLIIILVKMNQNFQHSYFTGDYKFSRKKINICTLRKLLYLKFEQNV